MADEQHKRAIIENSKAIKELTKSLSKSQGNTPPSEEKQRSESTGIKAVDNKIEDIKSAFSNNSTIKFFKDPVGSFGGGIKSVSCAENIALSGADFIVMSSLLEDLEDVKNIKNMCNLIHGS